MSVQASPASALCSRDALFTRLSASEPFQVHGPTRQTAVCPRASLGAR